MGDIIVVLIVLTILGAASFKLYKDKKNNVKCSGCPSYKANGSCEKNK